MPAETTTDALARLNDAGLAKVEADGTADIAHEAMRTWLRAGAGLRSPTLPTAPRDDQRHGAGKPVTSVPEPASAASSRDQSENGSRRTLIIEALLNDRRASYAAIAEAHGVSRQYVSRIAKEESLTRDTRTRRRKP